MVWGKAGSTTLGSAGDDLDITSMTANDFNQFFIHSIASGSMKHNFRFDDNSGSVYARGRSHNSAGKSNDSSQAQIEYHGDGALDRFEVIYGVNLTGEEKLQIHHCLTQGGSGSGTAPDRSLAVSKAVITNQYTRVDCFNDAAGSFDTGSNITALGSDVTPATAVPALATNLQVGSRYEETDTRKMYNLVGADTATFEDDFSGSDNWSKSPSDSQFAVDTTDDRLEFLDDENSTGDRTWYDLGTDVSTTQWVLRFKFRFTTLASGTYYYEFDAGLSDTTVDNNTNQNFIGFRCLPSSNTNLWRPRVCDGSSSPRTGSTANITQSFSTGTDYFAEIKRTSASNWAISLSTTNAYDGDLQDNSYTDASGATGLRYLKIGDAVTNTTAGADMAGYVDDVEFYNGITSVSTSNTWQEIGA